MSGEKKGIDGGRIHPNFFYGWMHPPSVFLWVDASTINALCEQRN